MLKTNLDPFIYDDRALAQAYESSVALKSAESAAEYNLTAAAIDFRVRTDRQNMEFRMELKNTIRKRFKTAGRISTLGLLFLGLSQSREIPYAEPGSSLIKEAHGVKCIQVNQNELHCSM